MKLDTAILLLREFAARRYVTELFAHQEGDCIVKVRSFGIHNIDDPLRIEVEKIANRIYKNVDFTVGANVVMMV